MERDGDGGGVRDETAEQRGKKPCSRDAEMLEFGIKRASRTQVWRPTSRRAPLQFASLWIATRKYVSAFFILWRNFLRNQTVTMLALWCDAGFYLVSPLCDLISWILHASYVFANFWGLLLLPLCLRRRANRTHVNQFSFSTKDVLFLLAR